MDDDRARGWLLARVELAVAASIVVIILIIGILYPLGRWHDPSWFGQTPIVAEAIAIIGLVWMVRIWRGPLRDRVPAWRYRDRG